MKTKKDSAQGGGNRPRSLLRWSAVAAAVAVGGYVVGVALAHVWAPPVSLLTSLVFDDAAGPFELPAGETVEGSLGGAGNDEAVALAIGDTGEVFVAGFISAMNKGTDLLVLNLNSADGAILWIAQYPLPGDQDPDGDEVFFEINWGDDTSDIVGPIPSGEETTVGHIWETTGTYIIEARARDDFCGFYSDSSEFEVTIPRNRAITSSFQLFLQQYPNLFQTITLLLQRLGLQ